MTADAWGRETACRRCGAELKRPRVGRPPVWCSERCQDAARRGRPLCSVGRCGRPAAWGRAGYPGHICLHHAIIWRDSQARLRVLELGRQWAQVRASAEVAS